MISKALAYRDSLSVASFRPGGYRCNPLRYIPVLWAAILSLSLYFLVAILLTIRTFPYTLVSALGLKEISRRIFPTWRKIFLVPGDRHLL